MRAATAGEMLELARRFDVEAEDAGGERRFHFGVALADAGEHDLARIAAGGDDARELAAGHDVEAAAEPREQVEDRERRIRLHRVADEVRNAGERRVERPVRAASARAREYT